MGETKVKYYFVNLSTKQSAVVEGSEAETLVTRRRLTNEGFERVNAVRFLQFRNRFGGGDPKEYLRHNVIGEQHEDSSA